MSDAFFNDMENRRERNEARDKNFHTRCQDDAILILQMGLSHMLEHVS